MIYFLTFKALSIYNGELLVLNSKNIRNFNIVSSEDPDTVHHVPVSWLGFSHRAFRNCWFCSWASFNVGCFALFCHAFESSHKCNLVEDVVISQVELWDIHFNLTWFWVTYHQAYRFNGYNWALSVYWQWPVCTLQAANLKSP